MQFPAVELRDSILPFEMVIAIPLLSPELESLPPLFLNQRTSKSAPSAWVKFVFVLKPDLLSYRSVNALTRSLGIREL